MRADFTLMQIQLDFKRQTQRAGNDARSLARAQIGTGHDEFRTEQLRDSLGGFVRLAVTQFGERLIMRRNGEDALAIAGAFPVPHQDQLAHARCESCKAAIPSSQLRTSVTFSKYN